MFIPQKTNDYSNVFTSVHQSASAAEAKLIAGQYHPLSRQFHLFADIYPDGDRVILEAPSLEMLEKMTGTLNYLLDHPDE